MVHHGQIIEKVVRKNGHSITDIAKLTKVNRRSVYNWFNQQHLKPAIIINVGHVINHDFSQELPQLFKPEDFKRGPREILFIDSDVNTLNDVLKWKDKYIALLESYNALLMVKTQTSKNQSQLR